MSRGIDGGEGVVYREGDERGFEWCVKEREKERYCWRAEVMSRNEGGEEETLFVWTALLRLNAYPLVRETVVREGMPAFDDRVIGSTLQSGDLRILECPVVFSFSSE